METRKVTIRDVAERAGVSISSVSRVFNDHPHTSQSLRDRVLRAVEELGYQPDFLGHSLRRGRTQTIGFLVGNIANPVLAEIFEGATQVLTSAGYATILVCSNNKPELDVAYLRFLAHRQVDGLLVSSAANGPDQASAVVSELGIPAVMLDRDLPPGDHVSAVQSDHMSSMRAVISHLAEQGCRRVAYIGGHDYIRPFRERARAFQTSMQEAGIPVIPSLVHHVPAYAQQAERTALELLAGPEIPHALIAAGNVLLIGVLQALIRRGIMPGRDLALVGADDFSGARLANPPVTVVGRDLRFFGQTAAELLVKRIAGQEVARIVELPSWLVVRESSHYSVQS